MDRPGNQCHNWALSGRSAPEVPCWSGGLVPLSDCGPILSPLWGFFIAASPCGPAVGQWLCYRVHHIVPSDFGPTLIHTLSHPVGDCVTLPRLDLPPHCATPELLLKYKWGSKL